MEVVATNTVWHRRLAALNSSLNFTGLLGYGIARNYRMISNAIKEYLDIYQAALEKYGTVVTLDETDTGYTDHVSIDPSSDKFQDFVNEIECVAQIPITVDLFMVPYKDAINSLTAEQMLMLEFMLVDQPSA